MDAKMKIPAASHFGLTTFMITAKNVLNTNTFNITARNKDQAWAKFVARYYRTTPLKPNRADFNIR